MLWEVTCIHPPGKLVSSSPTCASNTVVHLSLTFVLTLEFELRNICFHPLAACSLKAHLKRLDTSDDLSFPPCLICLGDSPKITASTLDALFWSSKDWEKEQVIWQVGYVNLQRK